MEVCLLIRANNTTASIKRVTRFLKKTRPVHGLKSDASAIFVFWKLEKNTLKTSKWTATKEEATVFLGNVLFDANMDEYSQRWPNSWKFVDINLQVVVIDSYTMKKIIKNQVHDKGFQETARRHSIWFIPSEKCGRWPSRGLSRRIVVVHYAYPTHTVRQWEIWFAEVPAGGSMRGALKNWVGYV